MTRWCASPEQRRDWLRLARTENVGPVTFEQLIQRYGVRAVPTTVLDDRIVLTGFLHEASLLLNLLRFAEGRPLTAAEARTGPATPLPTAPSQQQPRPIGSSGLVLPR